jgi:hypothetical protein
MALDFSGNSVLALVMRSAIISVLEENFGSVRMFGEALGISAALSSPLAAR